MASLFCFNSVHSCVNFIFAKFFRFFETIRFKKFPSFLFVLFLIFQDAAADVVWPALYLADALVTPAVIAADFFIETAFVKYLIKDLSWPKAIGLSIVMNAITSTVGICLIMFGGLVEDIALSYLVECLTNLRNHTFHVTHWIGTAIIAVLCNTLRRSYTNRFKTQDSWHISVAFGCSYS